MWDLRRTTKVCVIGLATMLAAVVVGVGTAGADDGGGTTDGQLVDVGKQLDGMRQQLAKLQAQGRFAKQGKLAAAADCGFGGSSPVFLPWGDPAGYSLIPQGDLSDLSGWTLKNVSLSDEHDPFTPGSGSLLFSKGDSEAATPAMCVNLDNPTLRLFLADHGGNGKATLDVKVLYEDLSGNPHNLTIARLKVNDSWQPSVTIPIGVNLLSVASSNGWTPVAFDFKVHGLQKGESFAVDGIYVDPCWSR